MNIAFLHGFGRIPVPVLAAEAASVFTPEYRPVGGVYYRMLYAIFGLNAIPFRMAFFFLLFINLLLAAILMLQVSGAGIAAFVGTAIFSFHAAMEELYFNDGTIYDVLCFFFVVLILCFYARIRTRPETPGVAATAVIMLVYGAALGSKEMAIMLPAVLTGYELLFHPCRSGLWRRVRLIGLLTGMTALYIPIKIAVPNAMSVNDLYRPRFDLGFIAQAYLHYHRLLFFDGDLTGWQLTLLFGAALAAAFALRSRVMLFGLSFGVLMLFPVTVIPARAGFVWYVPLAGYALYAGDGVARTARILARYTRSRFPLEDHGSWISESIPVLLCGSLLCGMYLVQHRHSVNARAVFEPYPRNLKALVVAAREAAPTLPRGSRILVQNGPFPEGAWEPMFALRLGYGDPALWVDRDLASPDAGLYTLSLTYSRGAYTVQKNSRRGDSPLSFTVTPAVVVAVFCSR